MIIGDNSFLLSRLYAEINDGQQLYAWVDPLMLLNPPVEIEVRDQKMDLFKTLGGYSNNWMPLAIKAAPDYPRNKLPIVINISSSPDIISAMVANKIAACSLWLTSNLPISELVSALAKSCYAILPGFDEMVWFRLYDPRTFQSVIRLGSSVHLSILAGLMNKAWVADLPETNWHEFNLAGRNPLAGRLEFSPDQLEQLDEMWVLYVKECCRVMWLKKTIIDDDENLILLATIDKAVEKCFIRAQQDIRTIWAEVEAECNQVLLAT